MHPTARIDGDDVEVSFRVPLERRPASPAAGDDPPPAGEPPAPAGKPTHSRSFERVVWYGVTHHFTALQRAVVALLWAAWEEARELNDAAAAAVHQDDLLRDADSTQQRLRDVFKGHPAWGTMIVLAVAHGVGRKGCYMLKAPDGAEG